MNSPSKALPSCLSSGLGPTYKRSPSLIPVTCRPLPSLSSAMP